jgi:uncharacterized membrane protein YdjX (TVP38/TMEM64 family)
MPATEPAAVPQPPPSRKRLFLLAGVLLVFVLLGATWRWGPLARWLTLAHLHEAAAWVQQNPYGPLYVIAAYLIAALTAFPVNIIIFATALLFEPWWVLLYAFIGTQLGAAAGYGLGHAIGRNTVRRLVGSRLHDLSRWLGQRGLLAVVIARLVPLAPFTVVNMVAGASHIRWRDLQIGTALGAAPGIVAIAFFADRLLAALRDPSATTIAWLAAVVVLIAGGVWALRRWLTRRGSAVQPSDAQQP